MKLSLNDKDGSLCLKQLHNVVYAKHLPLVLGTQNFGTCQAEGKYMINLNKNLGTESLNEFPWQKTQHMLLHLSLAMCPVTPLGDCMKPAPGFLQTLPHADLTLCPFSVVKSQLGVPPGKHQTWGTSGNSWHRGIFMTTIQLFKLQSFYTIYFQNLRIASTGLKKVDEGRKLHRKEVFPLNIVFNICAERKKPLKMKNNQLRNIPHGSTAFQKEMN